MLNDDNELPLDYKPCDTCGYDHEYEGSSKLKNILTAHLKANDDVINLIKQLNWFQGSHE